MRIKMLKTLLSILMLSLGCLSAFAQGGNNKISGVVKDNVNEAQVGATVTIKTSTDAYVTGASADIDGNFVITDVPNGNYKLVVSYIGFDDYSKTITVSGDINVGIIKMSSTKSTTLTEVKIVDKAPPVQQKEDTTQFNASSYKVNPDATAEDLIRKMPGMDLSTGTPQTQGEAVTKVLVDGKPFFGSDATSSLRNLPAEVIDKIQVYDEKSDQSQFTGFDDGNTSKTINIITRPGKKQGIFGKLYAGGGIDGEKDVDGKLDSRYNAGGNINFFEGDRRISLIGQTNNINVQNFSAQDLVGVSGTSGGRGGGGRGGMGGGGSASSNFLTGTQPGINKTNAVGFNYSDKWGKKIDVTASYFFNNSNNYTLDSTTQNYVIPAGQTYSEVTSANTNNYNHRINMRLNYTIDSSNSLLFVPTLSFQKNNSSSLLAGQTYMDGDSILNRVDNNYNSKKNGNNLSSMLLFRHKFHKKGRTFSIMLNGGTNSNDGSNTLVGHTFASGVTDTVNQAATSNTNGWNINSNATYTEPLSKKSFLQVQYGLNYQKSNADIRTNAYDYLTNAYTDLDTLLSNKFSTDYITNRGGFSYRFADSNFNFNAGVDFQSANLNNDRILPYNNTLERNFHNVLPNARLQYNFTKKKTLRLYYNTSTTAPSVSQLQDVVNNSNPLQLSSGNPNLVQSYQHRLFLRYSATNTNLGSTFFAMLSGTVQQNYIGNSTIIAKDSMSIKGFSLPAGGQYTLPENMSGYYNLKSFVTYGLPINILKSNLNINASAGYVRTPGMINLEKNYANNSSAGLGLVFSSNISEKIDFTLSSNSNYNIIDNTLNSSSNSKYFNQISRFSLNYIFWKGIVFYNELNHQFYSGLGAGYNQNYLLWNMSLAKKIFKKQQGEIKLSVYDLLNQNKSITPTVTETYTQYTKANVLQRYFTLTFTYNLRFFKGGASMKDTEQKGNREGGFDHGGYGPPPGGGPGGGGPPPPGGGGFMPGGMIN